MPNLPPIADTVEHAEAAVRTARTEFRRMRQARDRGEVPDAAISAARTAFRQQVAGKALTQLRCDLGTRERWRRHLDEIESVQLAGADMVIGNRMKNIHPGAMPWHHRYIGNPLLSGFLNLLFKTGVDDAHCGATAACRIHRADQRFIRNGRRCEPVPQVRRRHGFVSYRCRR